MYEVQIDSWGGWRYRIAFDDEARAVEFATARQRAESPQAHWRVVGPSEVVWDSPAIIVGASRDARALR